MLVKNIAPYEAIDGDYVVKFKKPVREYAKGYAFQLRIGDASGEMMLRYWGGRKREDVENLYNSINESDVVRIKGRSTSYKDQISININPPEGEIKILGKDEYVPSDFIPKSDRDPKEMYAELKKITDSIKNPHLKKLVESFIREPKFSEKFLKHPAAMYRHHGWVSGLLEHTLNVAKICDFLHKVHPELDRDVMIAGAILHDIGKMRELNMSSHISTSKEGMLLGHLTMSYEDVSKRADQLKIPEELALRLKHIIISHHGKLEYGSPKVPATPEAFAVHKADEADSRITEILNHIKTAETEDDYVYIRDFGPVYLKRDAE